MEDCIFCKIVRKEIPVEIVYEDENFVAFLDIHPESPGHVQVIPKAHIRWVWDVPNVGAYFEAARKIAIAQRKAFNTDWVLSRIVGEEVEHAHIWVYPDWNVEGDKTDLKTNAEKIRSAIASL
ncbi:MAG: histidine triad protein Hit-like protein involved in cell-cycle regulation [Parcubacteria group bacterium]|nr:histidine triad protein Hit-like protein involved in cell-cycle regulation [Parcubacteria group bacterium]